MDTPVPPSRGGRESLQQAIDRMRREGQDVPPPISPFAPTDVEPSGVPPAAPPPSGGRESLQQVMNRTRGIVGPTPLSDFSTAGVGGPSQSPAEGHVPIYVVVPSDGPETLQQSVDKARGLGMKVDRVDSETGAIVGSGSPGLVEHLRDNGMSASQPARITYKI